MLGELFFNFGKLSTLKSLSSDQLTLMWLLIPNFSVVLHHWHNAPDSYDKLTLLSQNKVLLNNIHKSQSQTNSSWIWVTPIQSPKSNNIIINEYMYLIPSICIKCRVDFSRQARWFFLAGLVTCNVSVSSKSMLQWIVCVFTLIRWCDNIFVYLYIPFLHKKRWHAVLYFLSFMALYQVNDLRQKAHCTGYYWAVSSVVDFCIVGTCSLIPSLLLFL